MGKIDQVNVTLPRIMHKPLRVAAAERGVHQRDLLADALELYLSVDPRRMKDVKDYIASNAASKWLKHKRIEESD